MQAYEIAIIIAACAFVLGVAVWRIMKLKKGKGGCDCCDSCCGCAHCKKKK